MERQKKKQKGITLIALVISIIVMLILAGVSLNMTVGENGIISQTKLANLMNKFSGYKEQLELNAVDDENVYASGSVIKNYIPNMESLDIEKFVIMKRELMYLENDELEIEACKNVGIQTADTGEEGSTSAISEVKAVINGVVDLASNEGDNFKVPEDDFDITVNTNNSSEGLVGIRLYDRNSLNLINKKWNILIEYDKNNRETARYGSGYYWLKKGETYVIDGESKKFENDFIVDYTNKQYYVLSERAINWNDSSTIAVSNGLVLNIDPTSLADGEWKQDTTNTDFYNFYVKDSRTNKEENTGIQKTGDVLYDPQTKALKFNESDGNTAGEGGYLKLMKSNVDFSKGFTFEIYANLDRLLYQKPGAAANRHFASGLFCRIPYLGANYRDAMRFGFTQENIGNYYVAKFYEPRPPASSSPYSNEKFYTSNHGSINPVQQNPGYSVGEDFYLTCVYIVYDSSKESELYDDYMKEKGIDKVEYYINGQLLYYTYYPSNWYVGGLNTWNNDTCPFFLGVCPWYLNTSLFYLKGKVYTTRLYTTSMNSKQVRDNYDTTLKYRSSF